MCDNRDVAHDAALVAASLGEARSLVLAEIQRVVADRRRHGYAPLYDQLASIRSARARGCDRRSSSRRAGASGGAPTRRIISATAVELFHNAFLVHDDIEDGSEFRRGRLTLPRSSASRRPSTSATRPTSSRSACSWRTSETLGVRKALLVIREIERMARESVGGPGDRARVDPAARRSTSPTTTTSAWPTRRRAGTP